jgi:glycosyltransferase involved in cell wall biosynthesis
MRLLFISEVYTPWQGGAIVAIRNLIRQLIENGNEVTLVTGEERKHWRLRGIRIEFDQECKANVYRIPAVPYPFNTMASMTIPDYTVIKKIIEKEKPDCIHVFSPIGAAGKIALKYAKRFDIPLVVTNHIMPENFTFNVKLPRPLQIAAENIIYNDLINFCNQARVVTAPTKTAIDLLRKHGLNTTYEAVTNGVDAKFFHPGKPDEEASSTFKLNKTDKHILYVGRLDGEKRVDLLIQAMPYVLKTIPHAKLLIAGKGLQRANLDNLVTELEIADAVVFLGMVTEQEKLALLQTADLFAIASPSELQCISCLEALSCGLPVVVANQMALKELTNGEKNGMQFSYPNSEDLGEKICILLNDEKLRAQLSSNGREWIMQNHQLSHTLHSFERIYHSIITKNSLSNFSTI